MPRVALLKNTYLPPSETFVHEQMRSLSRYEPVLFARERAYTERFPVDGPCVTLGNLPERLAYMLSGRSPRFERAGRRLQPDLIYAHFAVDAVYALDLAETLGRPLVVTLHAYDIVKLPRLPSRHLAWWRHALGWRRLQRRAAAFVVVSEAMRAAALRRGYPEGRVHLLHLGVDLQRFQPPAERPAGGPLRILHVGRLVAKKGLATLIEATAELKARGIECELTVIGDGPLLGALRKAVGANPRVRFLGPGDSRAVCAAMAEAQVFCLPSQTDAQGDQEGLPVVLMEAAATGLPLVGTRHSGIVEIVRDGETGILVSERDPHGLAEALDRLARDAPLRLRLGCGARALAEAEFDLRRQTGRLEALFDAVLEAARGGPPA
jgi:colanic acid/amylovoran biosynthesis glycosyltransferase